MPPNQQDNIWISREEYNYLRQIQQQAVQPQVPMPNQVAPGQATMISMRPDKNDKGVWQAIIGGLSAVGLYVSLTVEWLKLLLFPVLVVLVLFGAISLIDFLRGQRAAHSGATAAVSSRPYKTLVIILACILIAPVAFIVLAIGLFIILLSTGGGIG